MKKLLSVFAMVLFLAGAQAQNSVVNDSAAAVRIAILKGGRYYRSGPNWIHAVKLDSAHNVWMVMSTHRKEVHRKGHCPVIITKLRRVDIDPQTGTLRGRYKTKVKTPHPPPYF